LAFLLAAVALFVPVGRAVVPAPAQRLVSAVHGQTTMVTAGVQPERPSAGTRVTGVDGSAAGGAGAGSGGIAVLADVGASAVVLLLLGLVVGSVTTWRGRRPGVTRGRGPPMRPALVS
jgi:hypothetical protein